MPASDSIDFHGIVTAGRAVAVPLSWGTAVLMPVYIQVPAPQADGASVVRHRDVAAEVRFNRWAAEWRRATGHLSNLSKRIEHPAYKYIIGMGRDALPFLLAEMAERPGLWGPALEYITGDDPVPEGATGDLRLIANAWVTWGREHGYAVGE
jgi:hypothetical protein